MKPLDVDFARRQFPAFAHAETGRWAFFENAGGSYAPAQVIDKLHHFMVATKVQPYGESGPSEQAGAAMDESQTRWAAAINASPEEVMFGPSTSINTYVLAHALREQLAAGDEVIVTNQDHEANSGAWRRLADGNSGIIVREWGVDAETGVLGMAGLTSLLNKRTRLVFMPHCSNIVGHFNDVAAIARLVHEAGALLGVDGVSYAPHRLPDVRGLDADFYFFSLYKVFGPHQGLLYAKREHLERVANQGHFFNESSLGKRLTPAGPQHGEIACASGVIDYLELMGRHQFGETEDGLAPHQRMARVMDCFHDHETQQTGRILALLRDKGARILGPDRAEHGQRAGTIAFTASGVSNEDIASHLRSRHIACGRGHFYAWRLLEAMGVAPEEGVIRLSLVHYTSGDDVVRLLEALDQVL